MQKNIPPFEGFPADLPDFLWGLGFNNERPWFNAHREDFERCLNTPIHALAEDVKAAMDQRHPGLAPALHVSRIWRDARRLFGRGPFKEHMWFSLGVSGEIYTPTPQFWFGIDAKSWEAGMGCWNMKGDMLERWRGRIDADPKRLEKIVRALNKRPDLAPYWEVYKKPKGDPGPLLYDWYNARTIELGCKVWFEPDPPGKELLDRVVDVYTALMPLYQYLLALSAG